MLAETSGSLIQYLMKGGIFMLPLFACSLISGTVILLRAMALRRKAVLPDPIEQAIEAMRPGEPSRALEQLVKGDPSSLAGITRTALRHTEWSKSENLEAVQTRARHEMLRLEKGLAILEVIVGVAPMLGLLGTVSGLVGVFSGLGAAEAGDPSGIAAGIAEALSTTIVGLAVAIPSLIAHSYFSKKIETMAAEMESLIAELLTRCYSAPPVMPSSRDSAPR